MVRRGSTVLPPGPQNEGTLLELLETRLGIGATERVLGKDLLFTLTAIFVNPIGGGLRNRLAHGLMNTEEFFSDTAIYAWWLLLKCVVIFGRPETDLKAR